MKNAQQLRQKAIGVLYIISLLLFFLFYSIDYSDGLSLADKRVRQQQQGTDSVLSLAIEDMSGLEAVSQFEEHYRAINSSIDSARTVLGSRSGINAFGYLVRGGSREPGKRMLLDSGFFDCLLRQIRALDQMVVQAGGVSAIPGDSLVIDSKGRTVRAAAFYFDHSPLNAAMLYLTSFKSTLLLDRIRFYRALYALHRSKPGTDSLSGGQRSDSNELQYAAKDPNRAVNGDTAAVIRKIKPARVFRENDSLILPPPALVTDGNETVYIGQDNRFRMVNVPPGQAGNKIYYAVSGDAQVLTQDSSVYVRPSKRGRLILRAYAGNGKDSGNLLYQKELVAREFALPKAFLRYGGESGLASAELLNRNSALYARSEEPTIVEDIYVSDFDLFIIPDASRQLSVYLHNEGGTFNGLVSQALSKLKAGNVVVFTNINTKSTQGFQRQAQSLTVKIK